MSEQNTEQPVKVIFRTREQFLWSRKEYEREVIALFPELPGDNDPYSTCLSYQHVGQHGAAAVSLMDVTRPATPEEYAPLMRELVAAVGYNLRIGHRFTRSDFLKRRELCNPRPRPTFQSVTKI